MRNHDRISAWKILLWDVFELEYSLTAYESTGNSRFYSNIHRTRNDGFESKNELRSESCSDRKVSLLTSMSICPDYNETMKLTEEPNGKKCRRQNAISTTLIDRKKSKTEVCEYLVFSFHLYSTNIIPVFLTAIRACT